MKKTLCILLSLLLICASFSVYAKPASKDLRILVTSDTHWAKVKRVKSDRFYHPREDLGQMSALSNAIVSRFLKAAAASDADYVFISGDLTNSKGNNDPENFAKILGRFEKKTGKSVFVVPGNHDLDTSRLKKDSRRFRETYGAFGFDEAIALHKGTFSYVAELKNGYRLLALNSNKNDGSGHISDSLLHWIEKQARRAQRDGKKLIAMMHQQLMEHITMEQKIGSFYMLDNSKDVCELFDKYNIRLTFTGHMHISDIAAYEGEHTVYDVSSPSLATYPLAYRDVTLTDDAIVLKSRTIQRLDAKKLPKGYSKDQIRMITTNPVKYAYGCQRDSFVRDYIHRFLSPEFLADTLGMGKNAFAENVIDRLLPNVFLSFYGKGNTVEAKAKALGLELPKSKYKRVSDLLTAFWAALVRGDENFDAESTEGQLFLISAYVLGTDNTKEEFPFTGSLVNGTTAKIGLQAFNNGVTRAALDRLLVGFFVDRAPGDNNVTLDGYGPNQPH